MKYRSELTWTKEGLIRVSTILLTFMCILSGMLQLLKANTLNPDYATQISTAMGIVDGNGYTFTYPISQTDPLPPERGHPGYFPPLYSLLFAGAYFYVKDIWISAVLLNGIGCVIFFCSWFQILNLLAPTLGRYTGLFLLVYWGLIFNPVANLPPTDLLAVSLYSTVVALMLKLIVKANSEWYQASLIGILTGVCGWLRYAYWPLALVPPLTLLGARGRVCREWVRVASMSAVFAFAMMVALFIFDNYFHCTHITPLSVGRGPLLYWQNLREFSPFLAELFGRKQSLRWFPFALVFLGCGMSLKWDREAPFVSFGIGKFPASSVFALVTILTTVTITLMLSYLSITRPKQEWRPEGWTFVQETRYYAPIIVSASVLFFSFLTGAGVTGRLRRKFRLLLLPFITIAIIPMVSEQWSTWKVAFNEKPIWKNTNARELRSIEGVVRASLTGEGPVFYSDFNSESQRNWFAVMSGAYSVSRTVAWKVVVSLTRSSLIVALPANKQFFETSPLLEEVKRRGQLLSSNENIKLYRLKIGN